MEFLGKTLFGIGGTDFTEQTVKISIDDGRQIVACDIETMVGHAILGEIISPCLFGTVAIADLAAPLGGILGILLLLPSFQQP